MTVIGHDVSGLAMVIGFRMHHNLKGDSGGIKTAVSDNVQSKAGKGETTVQRPYEAPFSTPSAELGVVSPSISCFSDH